MKCTLPSTRILKQLLENCQPTTAPAFDPLLQGTFEEPVAVQAASRSAVLPREFSFIECQHNMICHIHIRHARLPYNNCPAHIEFLTECCLCGIVPVRSPGQGSKHGHFFFALLLVPFGSAAAFRFETPFPLAAMPHTKKTTSDHLLY